jgi:hypothetical protein
MAADPSDRLAPLQFVGVASSANAVRLPSRGSTTSARDRFDRNGSSTIAS